MAALVRMLAGKGKAGMVAEVLAEFAAICDHPLPLPLSPPAPTSLVLARLSPTLVLTCL